MSAELNQAIADLRKVVESNPNRDRFPVSTVIRWVANGRYTYLAVKTEVAWFTTARPGNPFVKQQLDYEELRDILSRPETTDIAIAASWTGLDGSPIADHGLPMTGPYARFREDEDSPRGRPLNHRLRTGGYPEGDPSADAGNHRTFADANPGVTFRDYPDDHPQVGDGDVGFGGNGEHV